MVWNWLLMLLFDCRYMTGSALVESGRCGVGFDRGMLLESSESVGGDRLGRAC